MAEVRQYRKKPVVIDAMQVRWLDNKTAKEVTEWCPSAFVWEDRLYIKTLEGDMLVSRGDFIIRGVQGEFYPCKPDIFAKTYEAAD